MTLPLIALAVAVACLAFSIYAAREVRRSHLVTMENLERARRDWERAARYRAEAAEIRAETEELRRQRKGTR